MLNIVICESEMKYVLYYVQYAAISGYIISDLVTYVYWIKIWITILRIYLCLSDVCTTGSNLCIAIG